MLVLTRKKQQSVRIGESITISVLKIKGNTVRLGIEAPDQVRVLRAEIPLFEEPGDDAAPEQPTGESTSDSSCDSVETGESVDVVFPASFPVDLVL